MSWLVALKTLGRFAGAMIASMKLDEEEGDCLHEASQSEER